MEHFIPVDTMTTSNFLREVALPDGSATLHFLMPVTGLENHGQPVMPPGFDKTYDLYLTIDATHPAGQTGGLFSSLNLTLWADPKTDHGTPSVSETSGPSFASGTKDDFIL